MRAIQMRRDQVESTLSEHKQIGEMTCVASAIEMILKLEDRKTGKNQIGPKCHHLQIWYGKGLSYAKLQRDFPNGICGLMFSQLFGVVEEKNGRAFDFPALFNKIDSELDKGKFVLIPMPTGYDARKGYLETMWHARVIYGRVNDLESGGVKYQTETAIHRRPGLDFLDYSPSDITRELRHSDNVLRDHGVISYGGALVGTDIWTYSGV